MSEQELLRADVLIAAARREARLLGHAKGEYPKELVERLADALEAATGGRHIDAVMQLESVIRRARKAPPVETFEGGIRQDSVYTILDSITLGERSDHEEHEFCDPRLGCVLPEDTSSTQ